MADPGGPSPEAETWLAPFRRACDGIAAQLGALPPARRAEPLGRGADRVAEDAMVAELEALGRPLTLISEELGEREIAGGGAPVIVLDPIDGSVNAKRGFPAFATAVAVADGRTMADVTLALVRDHGTGEEFVAERGRGAWLNGAPLALPPSAAGRLELLMVEGASPARVERAARHLGGRVRRLRAVGSLALSLCHTAAGRADAMAGLAWGRSVDVAAAQLVAREAGLLVGVPAPSALPASTKTRIVAATNAGATSRNGAAADTRVTIPTVHQAQTGSVP